MLQTWPSLGCYSMQLNLQILVATFSPAGELCCTQSILQLLLGSINSWLPDLGSRLGSPTVPGGGVIRMAIRTAAAQCLLFCIRAACGEGSVVSEGPRW